MSNITKAIQSVKDGSSVKAAASLFNIPVTTLHNHLRAAGIQSNFQKSWHKNLAKKDEIRNLRMEGLSFSQISKRTQVNESSIKMWCSDIILTDEQIKENLGVNFEKQKKAINFRKKGKYYTEIAKELNCSKGTVLLWISKYITKTGEDLDSKARDRKKKEDTVKSISNTIDKKRLLKNTNKALVLKKLQKTSA